MRAARRALFLCVALVSSGVVDDELTKAIRRGDDGAVVHLLAASPPPVLNSLSSAEKTPLLETLRATFHLVESLSTRKSQASRLNIALAPALASQARIRNVLLSSGARAGYACPLVDALVYRDLDAAEALLEASSDAEVHECLTSPFYGPDRPLHQAAKSHASGLARVLLATCSSLFAEPRRTHAEQDAATLMRHLRLRSNDSAVRDVHSAALVRVCAPAAVWKEDIDAVSGTVEVDVLSAAAASHGLRLATLLEARNEAGLTPLLVACRSGRGQVARRLAALGADSAAVTTDGRNFTCAHLSATGGFSPPLDSSGEHLDAFGRSAAAVALRVTSLSDIGSNAAVATDGVAAASCESTASDTRALAAFDPTAHAAAGWALAPAATLDELGLFADWTGTPLPQANASLACGQIPATTAARLRANGRALRRNVLSVEIPFIVRATADERGGWRFGNRSAMATVTREEVLLALGNLTVTHGSVPYAARYGQRSFASNLGDFVRSHMGKGGGSGSSGSGGSSGGSSPQYVFDAHALSANEALFAPLVARLAAAVPSREYYLRQLMLGPPLSGSHMHYHGRAANLLVAGFKLWLFSPPACAHFSTAEAAPWFRVLHGGSGGSGEREAAARLASCHAAVGAPLLRVLQAPGDVVVVPESWGHAVLNLADTMAIALEGGDVA